MTDMDPSKRRHAHGPRTRNAIVALAMALVTPAVFAHAVVVASQPSAHAAVAPGDVRVRIRFSSRIDVARSRLTLIAPDGHEAPLALSAGSEPGMLAATAHARAPGRFTLRWQVLSVDGHVTQGDIPFRVEGAAAR